MDNEITIKVKAHDETGPGFDSAGRRANRLTTIMSAVGDAVFSALNNAGQQAGEFAGKMASTAGSAAVMGAATTAATGGMNILAGVLTVAAGAAVIALAGFVALAPAILAVGGAAGATASLVAGLGATFAVLKIGLGGVSDAWSAYGKSAGGGGGAVKAASDEAYQSAKRIRDATRTLVDAKRQEAEAASAVNRARAQEVQRLRDLSLSLRAANLDQKESYKALQDAKLAMETARGQGVQDVNDIFRLNDDLERAQLNYDQAKNRAQELGAERKKADRDGINGSDQVQAALERQRAATEQVARATEQLADAHHKVATSAGAAGGGVNQFADAMAKLSPNARSVVLALIDVSKRFDVIKRQVQDRLFAGIGDEIEKLASRWLPRLGPMLGGVADALNSVFKGIGRSVSTDSFMTGIQTAVKATADMLREDIGPAVDHVIHAFGIIAGDSTGPMRTIGGFIKDIATNFDKWVTSAHKSGALQTFMSAAADTLQQIWDIGKLAFGIIGQIVAILFPGSKEASGGLLNSVQASLTGVSDWLKDKKNQQRLKDFITGLGTLIGQVLEFGEMAGKVARWFSTAWQKINHAVDTVRSAFSRTVEWLRDKGGDLVRWFSGIPGRLRGALRGAWDGLRDGFRAVMNWVISRWNSLSFTLPSANFLGAQIGGGTVSVPNIPYLASGGIGNGLAMVGERGRELVRLPNGSSVVSHGDTERALGGAGGGALVVSVDRNAGSEFGQMLLKMLRLQIRAQGGNVQQVLGVVGR